MLLLTLTAFVSIADALYFSVSQLTASDTWQPSESHSIAFTVSDPPAVYAQGGSEPANCQISWLNCDVPTCWTRCSANGYYAKVTLGTYQGADSFSLDVWQEFVYELANHNNATIPIVAEQSGYTCTRNDTNTLCTIQGNGSINQTLQTYYGGATPTGLICT